MCASIRFVTHQDELPDEILKLILRTQLEVRVLTAKEAADPKGGEIPILYAKKGLKHPFQRLERAGLPALGLAPKPWCPQAPCYVCVRDLEEARNLDRPLVRLRDERFKHAANLVLTWFDTAKKNVA